MPCQSITIAYSGMCIREKLPHTERKPWPCYRIKVCIYIASVCQFLHKGEDPSRISDGNTLSSWDCRPSTFQVLRVVQPRRQPPKSAHTPNSHMKHFIFRVSSNIFLILHKQFLPRKLSESLLCPIERVIHRCLRVLRGWGFVWKFDYLKDREGYVVVTRWNRYVADSLLGYKYEALSSRQRYFLMPRICYWPSLWRSSWSLLPRDLTSSNTWSRYVGKKSYQPHMHSYILRTPSHNQLRCFELVDEGRPTTSEHWKLERAVL